MPHYSHFGRFQFDIKITLTMGEVANISFVTVKTKCIRDSNFYAN